MTRSLFVCALKTVCLVSSLLAASSLGCGSSDSGATTTPSGIAGSGGVAGASGTGGTGGDSGASSVAGTAGVDASAAGGAAGGTGGSSGSGGDLWGQGGATYVPPLDAGAEAAPEGDAGIPTGDRLKFNFNHDWKFIKQDVPAASAAVFDDSTWKDVSLPHTYNDIDHYENWIGNGDSLHFTGKTWYRKRFKLPAALSGQKVFLELEGVRQAATVYINGTKVGLHENGVGPIGLDITSAVKFGAEENVIAALIDSTSHYRELATGFDFQWDTSPFLPEYGGIVKNVYLHVTNQIHATLPLFSNLGTTGTYVYATNIDVPGKKADITLEAEIANESAGTQSIALTAKVVDRTGATIMSQTAPAQSFAAGEKKVVKVTGAMTDVRFWSPDLPNTYRVYPVVTVGGAVVDAEEIRFGVRKMTFAAGEGIRINEKPIFLNGYAPRSTMEWANVGQAPNWLEEYDFVMMKQQNSNFLRPMHIAPKKIDVDASDKLGMIMVCPAGDSEQDPPIDTPIGLRWWQMRLEVMRDVMIYFRSHPSVMFWEAANGMISGAHMADMFAVRDKWDPNGGRFTGTRTPDVNAKALIEDATHAPYAYWSPMDITQTSAKVPVWDAEYNRKECPRRVWDKYSPPSSYTGGAYAGYKSIGGGGADYPTDTFIYNTSEDFARYNILDYNKRWSARGGLGKPDVIVGGAKIIFADGVSHGRTQNVEVARVSGSVDGARLPKESFYALKAAWSFVPDVEILGHWTYPAGTVKTMFTSSNCEKVKLATYDSGGQLIKDYGFGIKANGFEFSFAGVAWQPGTIKATCVNGATEVLSREIVSAGAPAKLKLTPILGPDGLRADGSDIAMFDVEITDDKGVRCPNQEETVNFTYSGEGVFLGGYNSGIQYSIFKDTLKTESGINRVFVRATRKAGGFTLNVASAGLANATATITSKAFTVTDGLTDVMPQSYPPPTLP
jgi:beta-galactosidase